MKLDFEHVMVDLETLGRSAGCSVLSIGAVAWDPHLGTLGPELYVVVNKKSCEDFGLRTDPDTLAWWEKQSPEARQVLADATKVRKSKPLPTALELFNEYLAQFGKRRVKLWGNGGDFDNAILQSCYQAVGLDAGWEFWNNRCYRTLKGHRPDLKLARSGTHHNALDDAKTQAEHAIQLWAALGL